MPTYAQLGSEPVWGAQYVPPVLTAALIVPLRHFYSLGPQSIGAPGDNNHLYGRHRSANWDRTSRYCTNRSYGTVDGRDKQGVQDWYRAVDVGITGKTLQDASRRMDSLVRSGAAPGVAEWFGTFDGRVVVGWFEGHASSSDSSHLFHLHVGLWNQYANDPATTQLLYQTITGIGGDDDMTPEQWQAVDDMLWRVDAIYANSPVLRGGRFVNNPALRVNELHAKLAEIDAQVEALTGVELTPAQLAAVAAAAQAGAEAGAPTQAELEAAAQVGAERAEDS